MTIDWTALRAAATAAARGAYAPYSRLQVGAAGQASDGRIVTGCNVENASYGLTLCAECGLVSALHAAVQLLVREGRELGEVATELNRHIHRWSAENKFITFIIASIDCESQTLEFVNAGHNPGYVLIGGRLETLKSHGLPIGMLAQSKYMTQTRSFPTGSTVVLYSDGITEAENEAEEEFGMERLATALARGRELPVGQICDRIFADVAEFALGMPQYDDQTLLLVRRT